VEIEQHRSYRDRVGESAPRTVHITGCVRGYDEGALVAGQVLVCCDGFVAPRAMAALDLDGSFQLQLPPAAYAIAISGVDHAPSWRRTMVVGDLHVTGTPGTFERAAFGERIRLVGELNDGDGRVVAAAPPVAERVGEGRYRIDLRGRPDSAATLRYQLRVGPQATCNGPTADLYETDEAGEYWSVVDVVGRDAVELDVGRMPPPGRAPRLQWTGEDRASAAIGDLTGRWRGRLATLPPSSREDPTEAIRLAAAARAEIDAEADPNVRALLRAARVAVFGPHAYGAGEIHGLRDEVAWVVDHVPADDGRLALLDDLDEALFVATRDADARVVARLEAWLERRAFGNPSPAASIEALGHLIHAAGRRRDLARVVDLYAKLADVRFEGAPRQAQLLQQLDPSRPLLPGKPLPDFDFAGLDAERVRSADRAGRLYLVGFWASWCSPCIDEMPALHDVYAAINGAHADGGESGLRRLQAADRPRVEFVFVSFDREPRHVDEFRRQEWSMPWTHAFVGAAEYPRVMEQFGFSTVPTAILVDEVGTILETGAALRGHSLRPTLERAVAQRAAG
jgi:thiol-disulfide isomerase/thioredoxin